MASSPQYGIAASWGTGIRRVLAQNPGPFTGTGTGTFIIGTGEVAVIDPGPALPQHIDNILDALDPEETVTHILITHTHADHSPGAALLKARTGAATFGFGPHGGTIGSHTETDRMEAGVDRSFIPDFSIEDGEILRSDNWEIQALHTPGHCSNHVCYAYLDQASLFCGDHLMAWSTTVILPPDGNIKAYLDSLQRLLSRPETIYYPTHGEPIRQPIEHIRRVIDHRRSRINQIHDALKASEQTLHSLREALYPDVSIHLHTAAEYSILASIGYLIETHCVRPLHQPGETARFKAI